jgi:hypothetical protein
MKLSEILDHYLITLPAPYWKNGRGGIKIGPVRTDAVRVPHIWPYISQDLGDTLLKFEI